MILRVICPLRHEAKAIIRRFGMVRDGDAYRDPRRDLALLVGGVGDRCAARTHEWLSRERPDLALLAGVCGGTDPALAALDLVLVARTRDPHGELALPRPPLERGAAAFPTARIGACLHVPEVVARAADKRRLTGALVIDMESAAVARAAADLGIPLAIARVVLDPVGEDLTDTTGLVDAAGRPRPFALALHLARHPISAVALARLGRRMAAASARLADWVESFARDGEP